MKLRVVLALLIAVMATPALANDSSFGGNGSALVPIQETQVQMASEDIVLERKFDKRVGGSAWHIHATYTFRNPTKSPITLQVGFPEYRCVGGEECHGLGGKFRRLTTVVGGVPVEHRMGRVDKRHKWARGLGDVYLFDAKFPPGDTVIVHTYAYDLSPSVDGESLAYVTRTGSMWNGPIGRARFTVRMDFRPWGIAAPPEYKLKSYVERPVGQRGVTEIIYEMENWTPKRDFELHFPNAYVAAVEHYDCPSPFGIADDPPDFSDYDDKKLALCRNLPYAVHGYTFKKKSLQRQLYKKPVRIRGYPFIPGAHDPEGQVWRHTFFAPNPFYTPSLLTTQEQAYVRVIKAEETRRKAAKKK